MFKHKQKKEYKMRARTLSMMLVLTLAIALVGCTDIRNIVGSAGCDNTLQAKVWHNGNVVASAYVYFEELGVGYYTDNTGLTPRVCCGSNTAITLTISYGGLSPTQHRVGIHVGDNLVEVGF